MSEGPEDLPPAVDPPPVAPDRTEATVAVAKLVLIVILGLAFLAFLVGNAGSFRDLQVAPSRATPVSSSGR